MPFHTSLQVPAGLLALEVPPEGVFLDTNVFNKPKLFPRLPPKYISAVVYAEFLRKSPAKNWFSSVNELLFEKDVRVVPFDGEAALAFWELTRNMQFKTSPPRKKPEDESACFTRLRFDLLVFAAALCKRRVLLTDNHTEFQYFPFTDMWSPPERLATVSP